MSVKPDFVLRDNVIYWRYGEAEERVGTTWEEIGLWFRTKLAGAMGVQVDSPEYHAKLEETLGDVE
jgi:hypothetical protein